MSMHEVTQVTRLQSTHAGRATLSKIGHDVSHLPVLPHISPPWEHIQIADPKPLPKNMGNEHSARRQAHARSHEKYTQEVRSGSHPHSSCQIVYVDASIGQQEQPPMFATAWTNLEATERGTKLHVALNVVHTSTAELYAILDFAKHADSTVQTLPSDKKIHYRVFTDSQEAFRACKHTRTTTPVVQQLRFYVRRLREQGHDLHLHWIPGHTGIPGNERAHRLARAMLLSAQSKPPEHILRSAPEEIEQHSDWYDPMEAIAQAKCYRRSYLLDVSNPLDIPPLPSSADTRRQQVLLRQVQTGTLLTPFLVQRFRRDRDLGTPNIGICGHCNTRADLAHLIWDCPLYSGTRQRVIAAIPPEWRPTSFQAWAQPGRITGAAANELWRSLLEYLDDPKAPAVGTRLRFGRDSQNVSSRDAH